LTFWQRRGKDWALSHLRSIELYYCDKLKELPEFIGNLDALKKLSIFSSKLTTLPKSLDDLLWRKAHETGGMVSIEFFDCPNLALSPKMKQSIELLKQNGTDNRLTLRYI
jgi:hypothetical protein